MNILAKHRILANPQAQPEVDHRADLVRRLQAAWDRTRARRKLRTLLDAA